MGSFIMNDKNHDRKLCRDEIACVIVDAGEVVGLKYPPDFLKVFLDTCLAKGDKDGVCSSLSFPLLCVLIACCCFSLNRMVAFNWPISSILLLLIRTLPRCLVLSNHLLLLFCFVLFNHLCNTRVDEDRHGFHLSYRIFPFHCCSTKRGCYPRSFIHGHL